MQKRSARVNSQFKKSKHKAGKNGHVRFEVYFFLKIRQYGEKIGKN